MTAEIDMAMARLDALSRAAATGSHAIRSTFKAHGDGRYVVEFEAVKLQIPKATALSLREMGEAARLV